MKHIFYIIILTFPAFILAEDKNIKYVQNDSLIISVKTFNGKPENWLRFYGHDGSKNEKPITITAVFDIENVRAIRITDLNAVNKKCGQKFQEEILFLSFDPAKNLKEITTRIRKPCFIGQNAVFKLRTIAGDDKRYYNITTLTAHPDAFNWSN